MNYQWEGAHYGLLDCKLIISIKVCVRTRGETRWITCTNSIILPCSAMTCNPPFPTETCFLSKTQCGRNKWSSVITLLSPTELQSSLAMQPHTADNLETFTGHVTSTQTDQIFHIVIQICHRRTNASLTSLNRSPLIFKQTSTHSPRSAISVYNQTAIKQPIAQVSIKITSWL